MANILIVHAHHEPKSFSSALARTAGETLTAQGHAVVYSNLNAVGFNPVSDRRNFTTVANPQYLKQQEAEGYATKNSGFAPDGETEMQKVEKCDLLAFSMMALTTDRQWLADFAAPDGAWRKCRQPENQRGRSVSKSPETYPETAFNGKSLGSWFCTPAVKTK